MEPDNSESSYEMSKARSEGQFITKLNDLTAIGILYEVRKHKFASHERYFNPLRGVALLFKVKATGEQLSSPVTFYTLRDEQIDLVHDESQPHQQETEFCFQSPHPSLTQNAHHWQLEETGYRQDFLPGLKNPRVLNGCKYWLHGRLGLAISITSFLCWVGNLCVLGVSFWTREHPDFFSSPPSPKIYTTFGFFSTLNYLHDVYQRNMVNLHVKQIN